MEKIIIRKATIEDLVSIQELNNNILEIYWKTWRVRKWNRAKFWKGNYGKIIMKKCITKDFYVWNK